MTLFSFLSDTILTHGNDNVNMNVLKYSEKRWLSTLFRSTDKREWKALNRIKRTKERQPG